MNELNYNDIIFFDLETSGLDWNKHEIIQIAAIDGSTGDEFVRLLDFDIKKADQQALRLNRFDQDKWDREGVDPLEAAEDFAIWIRKHAHLKFFSEKSNRHYRLAVMAGYNILSFDKFFLKKLFEDHGVFFPADYRMFDVYQLALWKYPNLTHYQLGDICNYLNIETGKLHDALEDVRATIKVARRITEEPLEFIGMKWR